jgi:hypothetical protein
MAHQIKQTPIADPWIDPAAILECEHDNVEVSKDEDYNGYKVDVADCLDCGADVTLTYDWARYYLDAGDPYGGDGLDD